jgi:hypothetical protein
MKSAFKILAIAVLFSATGTFTLAGSVHLRMEHSTDVQNRKVSGFHAVASTGSFDVVLKQGNTEGVRVEADAEVINEIVTEVRNGTLLIHSKNTHNWGNFWNNRKITIYVTAKSLNSVALTGSGSLKMENEFIADKIQLKLSGSGDFEGKINVKTVEVMISGSGDFNVAGKADESTIALSGSGDFDGNRLITKSTAIRISGSGDANIYASEKIDASVSGSGDIHYSGHPKSVSKIARGSGDISGS